MQGIYSGVFLGSGGGGDWHMDICSSIICLKNYPFSAELPLNNFSEISCSYVCVFLDTVFCSTGLFVYVVGDSIPS